MAGEYVWSGGNEVGEQQIAAIGGSAYRAKTGLPPTTPVVASAHLTDGPRAEGVMYPETPGVGPFPAGTDFGEASNPLKP